MKNNFTTKMLVEAGIMLALSYVLSLIPVFKMPFGGSVTAGSMIPLIIFAIRWGVVPGVGVGLTFGLLKLTQDPYIVHPIQLVLDYPLAFALLGLSGVFKPMIMKKLSNPSVEASFYAVLAVMLGFFGRYICHVLSGVVFFGEYAGDQNVWLYSFVYNSTYLVPDMIVAAILFAFIVKPIMKIAK